MKLYVVRHAEAQERAPAMRDFDRPLTAKGMKQAKSLGHLFTRGGELAKETPEAILSSPAVRALQTATLIAAATKVPVRIEPRLGLDSGVDDVSEVVRALLTGKIERAMIVGHNPTFEDFAETLGAGSGLKKAEMVTVDLEIKVKALSARNATRTRPGE